MGKKEAKREQRENLSLIFPLAFINSRSGCEQDFLVVYRMGVT